MPLSPARIGPALLGSLLLSVLLACSPPPSDPGDAATTADPEAAARLDALYAEYWEEALERNPVRATFVGDRRYNDRLPNTLDPAFIDESRERARHWLDRAEAIGPGGLEGQDLLSYEVFTFQLRSELDGYRFPGHLQPLNQFRNIAGTFAQLGAGTGAQPFDTVADHEAWLARAAGIPELFEQLQANMRAGIEAGVVQPRILMERVLPQLDALVADRAEDTLFWRATQRLPEDLDDDARETMLARYRTLIEDRLMPAYRELRRFVAEDYIPAARDSVGVADLPDGTAWYDHLVRSNTTTDLSAAQIHRIGLDEVARIHERMRALAPALDIAMGPDDPMSVLFEGVRARPDARFEDAEDLLRQYNAFRDVVEPLLPALFDIRPEADFEIREVEAFRARSASAASYSAPATDGSRPGIFYVNTYDIAARPRYSLESLYLHEATPGHHFQIALQRELDDLPDFRRFGGETAFIEGWGLYAESLGEELGVYTDPLMLFGALEYELWRSIRLVVDTGLHAKGWSRQDVLDYMYANSPVQPTRAVSEAERFMAIPGQALAYKIGELRIRELRNRAEAELGADFDVRGFHREVLQDGSVPLDVLEAKIERWIDARRG
ncbi:MAG: DUF885 domain-containing protein [Lysobacteraceae bacterium]